MKNSLRFLGLVFGLFYIAIMSIISVRNDQNKNIEQSQDNILNMISIPNFINNNLGLSFVFPTLQSSINDFSGKHELENNDTIPGIDNSAVLVIRGNAYRKIIVSNPNGVSLLKDYNAVNYSQKITPISSTSVEVELFTEAYIETNGEYPLSTSLLPVDVQQYLYPVSGFIQSDNPQIISLSQQIVNGAKNQTQVIENTIMWMQNNIIPKASSIPQPQDALSVLLRGTAVCEGYSTLTAAILRAAGIPTKVVYGCTGTIGHAWNEIYFPKIGWVPSDSLTHENYVQGVIYVEGADCSKYTYQIIEDQFNMFPIYTFTTPYKKGGVYAAENPLWNRVPFIFTPSNPTFLIDKNNLNFRSNIKVDYGGAYTNQWIATTSTTWLSPDIAIGYNGENIGYNINMTGYLNGTYKGEIQFKPNTDMTHESEAKKTVTFTVTIVDRVTKIFLPMVLKSGT